MVYTIVISYFCTFCDVPGVKRFETEHFNYKKFIHLDILSFDRKFQYIKYVDFYRNTRENQ